MHTFLRPRLNSASYVIVELHALSSFICPWWYVIRTYLIFLAGMTTKTDKLQSRNKFRSLVGVLSEGIGWTPFPRIQSLSPLLSQTVRGGAGSGTEGVKESHGHSHTEWKFEGLGSKG